MKKIRVTRGGCGIAYTDEHGTSRYALRTPEHGPFECDDAQADRLVRLGAAEYADDAMRNPGGTKGHLDTGQLESMTIDNLKALAADLGVDTAGCKKKSDYVAAIAELEIDLDDEDGFPELGASDPEA